MPLWSVLVQAGEEPLRGWDVLDALVDAVEAQDEALGASVAGGDEPSVFVSVEAPTLEQARATGERVVARALHVVGHRRATTASLVYNDEGQVVYQRAG